MTALTTEFQNYRKYVEIEIRLNQKIAEQSMTDRESFISKIRELKGIIRVPRLYKQYKRQLDNLNRLKEIRDAAVDKY